MGALQRHAQRWRPRNPQYNVEQYIPNFAVICGVHRVAIEVDGEQQYHRNWDGELCRRDQIQNQRLFELG